jgi:hypothetical protein
MTWGYSVVVDCGGVPVVYYNDDNGDIYAVPVLADGNPTQALYTGWIPNPVNYGGFVLKGVSYGADVDLLFIGTDANITDGNVTAVDPCTGTAVWDFLTTAGHQLEFLDPDSWNDPPNQAEAHTGGISYDPPSEDFPDPTLYFASTYSPNGENIYYSGGIVYSVDAATGSMNWASVGIASDYNAIALDGAHVINTGWSPWVTNYGIQKGPTAFSKETGAQLYTRTTRNPGQDVFELADGLLSCETEAPDWFINGNRKDFLEFYESDVPGINRFHRRMITDGGYEYGHHYAPSMVDEHLLFCYMNKLICFTPQDPRPRLDVPRYRINVPVPFGLPDPYTVNFPDPADPLGLPGAIGNLGGAPLTVTVVLSDTANGTIPADAGDPGGAPMAIVDPALLITWKDLLPNLRATLIISVLPSAMNSESRTWSKVREPHAGTPLLRSRRGFIPQRSHRSPIRLFRLLRIIPIRPSIIFQSRLMWMEPQFREASPVSTALSIPMILTTSSTVLCRTSPRRLPMPSLVFSWVSSAAVSMKMSLWTSVSARPTTLISGMQPGWLTVTSPV